MHILHISDIPFQDNPGGSRKYAHEIARQMALLGHQVSFIAAKTNGSSVEVEKTDGYRLIRCSRGNALQRFSATRRAFDELHRENRVDAVFIHFSYAALGYLYHADAKNIPTVSIFHGPWHQEAAVERAEKNLKNRLALRTMFEIERASLRRSDKIVALSRFMSGVAQDAFKIAPGKISIIPGGVDAEIFKPGSKTEARRALNIPDDRFIVFTVRRLARRMGLEDLIDAAQIIGRDVPQLQILIAGKGELTAALNQRIKERGVSKQVQLIGFVSDEQLPDYYRAADCFVLPTIALEGFGLVILEALACNTPVFGTPVAAIPDVLGLFDSSLTIHGTGAAAIAERIKEFAAPALGRNTTDYRKIIEQNYTWKHVAENLLTEISAIGHK